MIGQPRTFVFLSWPDGLRRRHGLIWCRVVFELDGAWCHLSLYSDGTLSADASPLNKSPEEMAELWTEL